MEELEQKSQAPNPEINQQILEVDVQTILQGAARIP